MRLAPNVHLASIDGDLVFLDAANDRYSCITRSDGAGLLDLLSSSRPGDAETAALTEELRAAGLVVEGVPDGGSSATRTYRANGDFHDIASHTLPVGVATWWRLAISALEAGFKSRSKPVRWLQGRPGSGGDAPVSRACTLALQFDRLRPYIPWSGRCLPNSLLLLGFLRRHGIDAALVLGVHTFPFEAHCWVEYQGVVLNDTIEHVRWYTPIALA